MRAHVLVAVCVLLATATEVPSASALHTAWSNIVDDTGNSLTYFVETKQELFVFGKAVPASIMTQGTNTVTAPSASTCAPSTSSSAPATSTSTPSTSTSAPSTSTSAPATSSRARTTGSSVLTMGTDTLSTTSNSLLPSSPIPLGYRYYPTTGSYYKLHRIEVTWDDANTTCASEGAHLVELNDAEEADIVTFIAMNAAGRYDVIWTGLRDNRPGGDMEWRTVKGESLNDVYHVWGDGRPLNDAEYACAGYYTYDKQLFDSACGTYYYYICEMTV